MREVVLFEQCYRLFQRHGFLGRHQLQALLNTDQTYFDITQRAFFCKDRILVLMNEIRVLLDEMEEVTRTDVWPYPTYGAILFSVK